MTITDIYARRLVEKANQLSELMDRANEDKTGYNWTIETHIRNLIGYIQALENCTINDPRKKKL